VARLARRILEELILERLSATVDPDALLTLESEIARSVDRAIDATQSRACSIAVAQSLIRRAWSRLGRESLVKICDEGYVDRPDD